MPFHKNICTIKEYLYFPCCMKRPEPHLQLYQFLEDYIYRLGYAPTIKEMTDFTGKSRGAVQNSLNYLETEGYIIRSPGKARTMRLLKANPLGVPIWGTIAAGYLTEPFTDGKEYLPLNSPLLRPGDFALRVAGNSMQGEHIPDGSTVIMRPVIDAQAIRNGTVVAAWVEGRGTTLKRLYAIGDRLILEPANPDYQPIRINLRQTKVEVQGVLLWVWQCHFHAC
jgi:repressor LexA